MRWRQLMRTMLHFGRRGANGGSEEAVQAAEQSHAQAVEDRVYAARTRAVAEQLEAQIHRHNSANRYDDWLAEVMRGEA